MHPDESFLRDHLKDVRAEMSWRRELEFRLLQFLIVFYPIVGTAMVTLYQSAVTPPVYLTLSVGASLLIIGASAFITDRIRHEHKAYADLGRIVQKIWTFYGLFEPGAYLKGEAILSDILRDPKSGLGQGQGYRKTLALIWLVTIAMVLTLFTLAILKR
jgi:hypothetical protein